MLPPRQFFSPLFVLSVLFSLSAAAVVINISGRGPSARCWVVLVLPPLGAIASEVHPHGDFVYK